MIHSVPTVGLIPARGGSKGLPQKNLRKVGGLTLVARAVDSARQVGSLDRVIVSSDSQEILDEARAHHADVHHRSDEASTDEATASDVMRNFAESLSGTLPEDDPFIVYLQPTSPLRTAAHIADCLEMVHPDGPTVCVSVQRDPVSVDKLVLVDSDGLIRAELGEAQSSANRQDCSRVRYRPNGAIYVFRLSDFLARNTIPIDGAVPYYMDRASSIDIDGADDLLVANRLEGEFDASLRD